MKNFWSRYRLNYCKVLVYMLQTSEYETGEYIEWLNRTKNFHTVMQRGQLKRTKKAQALLAFLYLLLTFGWLLIIGLLIISGLSYLWWLVIAVVVLLLQPYLLGYGIVLPLWLGHVFIQKPREKKLVSQAKSLLTKHSAIKIGIAGSYGKTSMKEILLSVLSEGKKVSATPGNMNTPVGISRFVNSLKGDEEILIFELGEYYPKDIKKTL